jgi:hypothetical protein
VPRAPPQLRELELANYRHGHLEPKGLSLCEVEASLVGKGRFAASVLLPEQSPFPSEGELYAFNGTYKGKPAILAHVYGTDPVPTSFTLPFTIQRQKGTFGTVPPSPLPGRAIASPGGGGSAPP